MEQLTQLQRDVQLAPYTTYQIGGPADYFVSVRTQAELIQAVRVAREQTLPYFILGTGANILIGDRGWRGLVIHNQAQDHHFNGQALIVDSGATIANLITLAAKRGLSGLEHFAGIPSSVGGALWQNLHFLAPDRQSTLYIGDILTAAKLLDSTNNILDVEADFFKFGYDDSILHHQPLIVLEASFQLTPKPNAEIEHQIKANLAWRRSKQPQLDEFASCGSVFQKIEGQGAGRLIEAAGLKGRQIGGAQVSTKHANYIVNLGQATAKDVRQLIKVVQDQVAAHSGFRLQPEISFVGEF